MVRDEEEGVVSWKLTILVADLSVPGSLGCLPQGLCGVVMAREPDKAAKQQPPFTRLIEGASQFDARTKQLISCFRAKIFVFDVWSIHVHVYEHGTSPPLLLPKT